MFSVYCSLQQGLYCDLIMHLLDTPLSLFQRIFRWSLFYIKGCLCRVFIYFLCVYNTRVYIHTYIFILGEEGNRRVATSAAVVLIYVVKFTVDVAANIKIIREIMYNFFSILQKTKKKLIKIPCRRWIELREGF